MCNICNCKLGVKKRALKKITESNHFLHDTFNKKPTLLNVIVAGTLIVSPANIVFRV